ncbi:DUF3187 family protein [Oceanicoccus sp. KOV_DT_Chl]|uniref:DUF3187 family protein n=1 Tax=Oceanicoccus sp. KOV_DT_Chl TaxID=1904639 RepID=UPI000C7DD9D7|nr:DUF3187 family protein [Oceanicoccus sp. KOV_DT_Chl]
MKNKINKLLASVLLVPAVVISAAAADRLNDPYVITSRSPFVQIYGLPAAQGAELQGSGQWSGGLQIDVSNNFAENDSASEQVFIDGETHRVNLQGRYGLNEKWELGIDVPYLSHKSGGLDSFIDDWHDFWGFPDGDRPAFPQDQLQFSYQNAAGDSVLLNEPEAGVGDVSLSAAYQLSNNDDQYWALRAAVKIPTGDADSLLGSESTDISLALNFSDQQLGQSAFAFHGSAGVMFMDDGEVLSELREDWVVFGSSTLSWLYSSAVSLKLQLDVHSAFYDSGLTELGDDSAQLIIGGAIRLSEHWLLDLAVSEDIAVDTAPDVVFHIGVKAVEW